MSSTRNDLLEKILKIKALADTGVEGEKEAAKRKLTLLMDRYGLTDDDLGLPEMYYFKYNRYDSLSKTLLNQVIYSVMGGVDVYRHKNTPDLGCNCTKSEAVEIEAKYGFYYNALKKDMKLFLSAFVMKNHIYPPKSKRGEIDITQTAEEQYSEDSEKAYLLSKMLEKREYHKQLEA